MTQAKINKKQRDILFKMANGWELGSNTTMDGRSWIQEGGTGHGGKSEEVHGNTVYALWTRGLIKEHYGFPTTHYTLTEAMSREGQKCECGHHQLNHYFGDAWNLHTRCQIPKCDCTKYRPCQPVPTELTAEEARILLGIVRDYMGEHENCPVTLHEIEDVPAKLRRIAEAK